MADERNPAELPSFLKFSEQGFYVELNERFIKSLNLRGNELVLDLASGPGNTSRILDRELGSGGVIVALDISRRSLEYANGLSLERPFCVVQGTADKLPFIQEGKPDRFDVVFCGNAIHNFPDKKLAIQEINRVSRFGGLFAFNSSFYEGAIPDDQRGFYKTWVGEALNRLKERGFTRDQKMKVAARKQLTSGQYQGLLESEGFEVLEISFETVDMPLEGFKAIAEDDEFTSGALSGYLLDQAKEALTEAAKIVFKEMGMEFSPRNWMKVTAVKKSRGEIQKPA